MRAIIRRAALLLCLFLLIAQSFQLSAAPALTIDAQVQLSEEERDFAAATADAPLRIGIIPHNFPLSDCPPEVPDYVGINIEMLELVSELTGLCFEYYRIPIEDKTPYQTLKDGELSLVAGTIKLEGFLSDPELILSDRLCDGSAACISQRSADPAAPHTRKIAVMKGYQAGLELAAELFPTYEMVTYPTNQAVMRAVRDSSADLAVINRYVGIYELQNPLNEYLMELTTYKMGNDSCVMGVNTPENKIAVSIINKAFAAIGEDGYNYVQMNFSLTHPYKLSLTELIYKYRYILFTIFVAAVGFCAMAVRLMSAQKEHGRLSFDPLTGAFSEAGFELAAAKTLSKASSTLFIIDFDIFHFSSYNELNGKEQGDELLRAVVRIVKSQIGEHDIICRTYADHFRVLCGKASPDALISDINITIEQFNLAAQSSVVLNFGIYPVTDVTVPIPKMLDFAAMAKKHIKNDPNAFVYVFNEELLNRYVSQAKMTSAFPLAIKNGEFVPFYQPKFDSVDKRVIGAEALVRWISSDGVTIPPIQFIELFEKSGQIQQLDFYMLEQVCILLNRMRSEKLPVLPIAVNFSRVHLYSDEFITKIGKMVEKHNIPKHLIEIECTETTMLSNIGLTKEIFGKLRQQGFSIAMDDFGSAYSSLNTLCSIPLDVLKLDRGFLLANLSHEKAKASIIISSVIALAHDLSLRVVAEGVETEEQYMLLKGLGCDFIQGYYFSRPLDEQLFLELLNDSQPPV